jgi:hypothetical protein
VYDTDLDITWLADANAGVGSTFDNGGSTTDGRMTWVNANAWAASLTVGGFSDWRLPSVPINLKTAVENTHIISKSYITWITNDFTAQSDSPNG